MDKVAVRKAVRAEFPLSGGPPIMMVGGGGRGGRGPVGVTRGQRALGALGTLAGVAGALTGQHRSLGGLVQSAVSGGATGRQLGRGIGRALTTRTGQARADLREQAKQARAMERASLAEQLRERGEGPLSRINPVAAVRRRNTAVADRREQELDRVNRANRAMQVAVQQSGQEYGRQGRQARRVAEARARAMAGEDVARDVEFAQTVRDRFAGMTDDDVRQRATMGAAAAASPDEAVRVDPPLAEFEEGPQPVDASGRPVAVQLPQLPPPPGSVASGDQSADPVGNTVTTATGFNMQTENEPGDVAVRPSRPTEGEGDDPMQPSAMSQQAMRNRMERQNRSVAVEDRTRQARMEEF